MKNKESDFERSVERTRTYVTERTKLLDAVIRTHSFYFVKTRCCDKERERRDLSKTQRTERTRFWANRG